MSEYNLPTVVQPPEGFTGSRSDYKPSWEPKEGYSWVCTIFGAWVQIPIQDVGVPHIDPSYERYWCM